MTTIIGIGNQDRGDDAAGLAVARLLREGLTILRALDGDLAPRAAICELAGDQLTLLDAWGDDEDVYVVDATCSGGAAGTVSHFDGTSPPDPRFQHRGTHTFSLADVLELGRVLGQLPGHLAVYGIEGKSFGVGDRMSAPVQAAVVEVTCEILRKLRAGARTMCLGTIGVITAIHEDKGIPMAFVATPAAGPDEGPATTRARLLTCPDARPGQVVVVHSGYVLRILDGEEPS